jgi:transposase-like protein
MTDISYRGHRFPPIVIQHAVWLYLRFTLSYRDVEELLAERGLDVSYETVRSWVRTKAAEEPSAAEQSLASRRECAANARPAMGVRSCIEDEGRPLEAGRQGQASNYRKLRR